MRLAYPGITAGIMRGEPMAQEADRPCVSTRIIYGSLILSFPGSRSTCADSPTDTASTSADILRQLRSNSREVLTPVKFPREKGGRPAGGRAYSALGNALNTHTAYPPTHLST
ncbi:hypothetical protein KM043_004992 [Ampulex compressa]|nr:hypothetical protein KM043_004992 [Ampulex compressa]